MTEVHWQKPWTHSLARGVWNDGQNRDRERCGRGSSEGILEAVQFSVPGDGNLRILEDHNEDDLGTASNPQTPQPKAV